MIRDCNELLENLYNEIRKQTDIAVVGLSGGADSSLAAILSMKALNRENVFGFSMPYNEVDIKTFNARSSALADKIRINHQVRHISTIADAINEQIYVKDLSEVNSVNQGNSRSRARMCLLYGVAHNLSAQFPQKRVRVIGTGNLSEDYIGYDTKGGDALADFFPIGQLFKSEVYQLLDYFKAAGLITEEQIDRTPSAGLEENQTDEMDLGYTYNEMETGIRYCLANENEMAHKTLDKVTEFVWKRHLAQKHKHEVPVVISLRSFCD